MGEKGRQVGRREKEKNLANVLTLRQQHGSVDMNLCHCSSYSHHEVSTGNWFLSALFSIISCTHNVAQNISVLFSLIWNYIPIDSLFPSSLSSGRRQPIFWFYKFAYLILAQGSRFTQWVSYVNSSFHLAQCPPCLAILLYIEVLA